MGEWTDFILPLVPELVAFFSVFVVIDAFLSVAKTSVNAHHGLDD